ncbi:MAG: 1-acyl-sn-glycerol-3-phosphate acyltransferase [Myxococcota bacterium]|nr:1-acyl-sn-glycerol-3-phosphate acyltransferase [Myxococcota bacterium]
MQTGRLPKIVISWWLGVLQWLLVRYIKVDNAWVRNVKEAATQGRIIFVLRNRSLIDLICLRGLCKVYGLPQVGFAAGIGPFLYTPLWLWILRLFRRKYYRDYESRLSETLENGRSAVVFLRRPATRNISDSRPVRLDGIRLAVAVQSRLQAPILALPTVFLWGEHAMNRLPGTMDFLFGSSEYPRLIRSIWLLMRRRSVHELIVGPPLNFLAIKRDRQVTSDAFPGVIRAGVGRQIELIRRSKLGSLTKSSSRLKTEVLSSPRLNAELATIADEEGMPAGDIPLRAKAILDKLAADFRPRVLAFFAFVMAFIWKRIYTGIDFLKTDMEKMRAFTTRGPTLILPNHKSHIDYIVVSQVMLTSNMVLPHIAAGQNLSFWPLGWLFRSSGAFFIRRRFVNDRFYSAVVNAYIRRLIQEGYAIEIFIEGGRSRTGKLLRPKSGMLEMAIRALAISPRLDISVVPMFIGYERVIEEQAYVRESLGRKKKSESFKGLIKSTRVLFHRYGQLYVRTGNPFTLTDVMGDLGMSRDDLSRASARRELAMATATRNLNEITRITIVTPSAVLATALLSHRSPRITHPELRITAAWLVDILSDIGATLSSIILKWQDQTKNGQTDGDLLDRTIRVFLRGGRIQQKGRQEPMSYAIRDDQRLPLDYYKNNIINFFAPISLVASICLTSETPEVGVSDIAEMAALMFSIYKWEFMLAAATDDLVKPGSNDMRMSIGKVLAVLVRNNILEERDGRFTVCDRNKALLLSDILLNYHEVYLAVIAVIRRRVLEKTTGDTKKLSTALLQERTKAGEFVKPEGHSRINIQNAIQAYKELKILRPAAGETPFDSGGFGDKVFRFLSNVTDLT